MIGLIPRPLHAVMDYLWAIAVFFAPDLFGFKDNQAASAYCKVRGGSTLAISLLTRYELGLIKLIPFNVHLFLDFASAVFSFCAPQLLGFNKSEKGRQATFAFSAVALSVVLLSKRDKK